MKNETSLQVDLESGAEARQLLLEQYKIYVASASDVSNRRGAANTFLMTANTGLVTVYGLVVGKDVAVATAPGAWKWLAPVAGVAICISWFALIRAYRALNSAKYAVILELERHFPAPLFKLEWEHMGQGRTWRNPRLSVVEQLVPVIFGAIYLALIVAAFV